MKLHFLFFCTLLFGCSHEIFIRKENILKSKKGILIMTGNNSMTYVNVFIPDNKAFENYLIPFLRNKEIKTGEEVEFSKSRKE